MPGYSLQLVVDAPIETVFAVMSDHVRYAEWSPVRRVTVDVVGDPAPNGLGAVRRFHAGPMSTLERVVAYEPPHLLAYVLDKGLPVRGYRADMVLAPHRDGVELSWTGTFEPRFRGTGGVLLRLVERSVQRFAEGIKAVAEAEGR